MKFKLNDSGEMSLVIENAKEEVRKGKITRKAYIVDVPKIKESIKSLNFLKTSNLSFAGAVTTISSHGVFWKVFLIYIFPWMTDIAKVYCCIRIAQAFYQEKRGGRDDGTGIGAIVQYGKWYLLFLLLPWAVELIDEIGNTMYHDLKANPTIINK